MRRKDKEISDPSVLEEIIRSAKVCRVGFSVDGQPYIVPMSFGYQDNILYFHCANEGRKLECIRKNPNVCFEFDEDATPLPHEKACRWSMKYKSIIGYGRVEFVRGTEDKRRAFEIIMRQYSQEQFEFPTLEIEKITIFMIIIEQMSGKQSGY